MKNASEAAPKKKAPEPTSYDLIIDVNGLSIRVETHDRHIFQRLSKGIFEALAADMNRAGDPIFQAFGVR